METRRPNPLPTSELGGAGEGTRTLDIQLGKLTLYQLSYARILMPRVGLLVLCTMFSTHFASWSDVQTSGLKAVVRADDTGGWANLQGLALVSGILHRLSPSI